jgi:hypothetical protein
LLTFYPFSCAVLAPLVPEQAVNRVLLLPIKAKARAEDAEQVAGRVSRDQTATATCRAVTVAQTKREEARGAHSLHLKEVAKKGRV